MAYYVRHISDAECVEAIESLMEQFSIKRIEFYIDLIAAHRYNEEWDAGWIHHAES